MSALSSSHSTLSSGTNPELEINGKGLLSLSLKYNCKINNTSETVKQSFLHRYNRTQYDEHVKYLLWTIFCLIPTQVEEEIIIAQLLFSST